MTKKKLTQKGPEIIDYEEQTLNSVKQQLADYNKMLNNLGLVLDIDLIWYYQGDEFTYSRIEFANGYICAIDIQVRKQEDEKHDLDLEAITFMQPISQVGLKLFRYGSQFSKIPQNILQELLDSVKATIQKVLSQGYETVLNNIKEEINSKHKNNRRT